MKKLKSSTALRGLAWLGKRFVQLAGLPLLLIAAGAAQTAPLAHLQHGVNIGRFMDGKLENDSFGCCDQDKVKTIREMGFDHLRVLIKPGLMFDFNKRGIVEGKSLDLLDQLVGNCVTLKVGIILSIALDEDRFQKKLGNDNDFTAKPHRFLESPGRALFQSQVSIRFSIFRGSQRTWSG